MTGDNDGLPPLREVIERHGLAAKKSLGQNFLFDLNLTRRIARTALPFDGHTIVESALALVALPGRCSWKVRPMSLPWSATTVRWPRWLKSKQLFQAGLL